MTTAPNRTHAQELVALRTGRNVGDLLREMHVDRQLSQGAIANELGVSRNTVAMWLREFGITRADPAPEGTAA
jgi:plasmid maintenance system antidote protein VapI